MEGVLQTQNWSYRTIQFFAGPRALWPLIHYTETTARDHSYLALLTQGLRSWAMRPTLLHTSKYDRGDLSLSLSLTLLLGASLATSFPLALFPSRPMQKYLKVSYCERPALVD